MNRPRRVFFDGDVIIDVLLERDPHVHMSRHVLTMAETGLFTGYTSSLILANSHYIISKQAGKEIADRSLTRLTSFLEVLSLTGREIKESLESSFRDFEDGIQYYIAVNNGMDCIVTRNIGDYKTGGGIAVTPAELIDIG